MAHGILRVLALPGGEEVMRTIEIEGVKKLEAGVETGAGGDYVGGKRRHD